MIPCLLVIVITNLVLYYVQLDRGCIRQISETLQDISFPSVKKNGRGFDKICSSGLWQPRRGITITNYSKDLIEPPNCKANACSLNRGRTPIRTYTHPRDSCRSVEECVTVTIKTRHRYTAVKRLVSSIEQYYPGVSIVVMDEYDPPDQASYKAWLDYTKEKPRITYHQAEQGISIGRIEGLKTAKTKYVLISDDDFEFVEMTNITKLLTVIEHTDADIVGASVNKDLKFQGVIRVEQPKQQSLPHATFYGEIFHEYLRCFPRCYAADFIKNFFLVDREKILQGKSWDTYLRFIEHRDVFLQMRKRSMRVAYCEDVIVKHMDKDVSLRKMRLPFQQSLLKYTATKWNLSGVPLNFSGKFNTPEI